MGIAFMYLALFCQGHNSMANSSWFSQLGIKGRILSMIWVSVVMATGVVGINYWANSKQAGQLELQSKLLANMMALTDFGMSIKTLGLAAMDALVDADSGTVAKEVEDDVSRFEREKQSKKTLLVKVGQDLGKSEEVDRMLSQSDVMYSNINELMRKIKDKSQSSKSFSLLDDEIDNAQNQAFHLSQELTNTAMSLHHESVQAVTKMSTVMTYVTVGANAALLMLLLVMGLATARSITAGTDRSAKQLTQTVGDLSYVVGDLDKAGHTLAGTATEQNASVTETVSAMTEIQSVIKRSSEYSRSVVHLAKEAKGRSEEGSALMTMLSQAVNAVKMANQELDEIKKIFQKIEAKTTIVNNISFKTQLLSFNASIEAARAGANGRGFSVVALEVGRLADMSAKAADEIGGMLKESVAAVSDIVERLSSKVDEASRTNTAALGQFAQIVTDINEISGKISEIERGINEQSAGVDQCVKAMQQLSIASQSNDELSSDISSLSGKLQMRTRDLEETVLHLNKVIQGQRAPSVNVREVRSDPGADKNRGKAEYKENVSLKVDRGMRQTNSMTDDQIIEEIASATQKLIHSAPRPGDEDVSEVKKSA
jgi:peptidoglycan hydrolase CwlO-like protein